MTSKNISFLIWALIILGISGTYSLVNSEFTAGDICPKIIGIPACYIIMACLIFALVSHSNLLRDKNRLYYVGIMTALTIATIGSIGNLLGYLECPTTASGTPMCYISFALFFCLFVLKLLEYLTKNKD